MKKPEVQDYSMTETEKREFILICAIECRKKGLDPQFCVQFISEKYQQLYLDVYEGGMEQLDLFVRGYH